MGCVVTSYCPQCSRVAKCTECEGTGEGECPSGQCDGRWHECHFCDIKPKNYIDCLASDEALQQFLDAHPLSKAESLRAEAMVQRLRNKLGGGHRT